MHAGSVALVLNPKTGHVSPQYHVVFNNNFTTVQHMRDGTLPPSWQDMCQRSSESATNEAFDLVDIWFEGRQNLRVQSRIPLLSFLINMVANPILPLIQLTRDLPSIKIVRERRRLQHNRTLNRLILEMHHPTKCLRFLRE